MKIKFSHLFLTIILVILILLTMSNTCVTFKPYNSSSMNYSTFENFGTVSGGPKTVSRNLSNLKDKISETTNTSIKNLLDSNNSSNLKNKISNSIIPGIKESFVNLDASSSPYGSDSPIDVFSGTKGNISCDGNSSGLTNSMAGLCLNKNLQQLLSTRGGNATGRDSQIG